MESADWKMDEKIKSENMQKRAVFYVYYIFLRAIRAGRCRERRYAVHMTLRYTSECTIS